MSTELRSRNQSRNLYVRALTSAWRHGVELHDPSLWLAQEPDLDEKLLRDADIKGAVQKRRHQIAGSKWAVNPLHDADPRAPLAVSVATELIKLGKHFAQARLNLALAFLPGARFARVHYKPAVLTIGDGRPRTWMVPRRFEDLDKRMFRIVPENDGERIRAHWEFWNTAKGAFEPETLVDAKRTIRFLYQDDQASLGYGRGLREALAWWWYAKEHVFAESLQAVERFAQGILTAKVNGVRDAATGQPNVELIRQWREVLEDMRARHVLVYDADDTVESIQMNGEGWNLLKDIREELKSTCQQLILGSDLATDSGDNGSRALGEVHQDSTEMLIQFDRESLEEALTDDLIGGIWWFNHANLQELGIYDQMPRFSLAQEKMHDPAERAATAQTVSGMGVPISAEDVREQTGFRKPEPGEEIVKPPAPEPPPGFGGFGGFGGPPPGGPPPA